MDENVPVDTGDNPLEEPFVCGLGNGLDGELDLFLGLALGHVVTAHLDAGLEEGLSQVGHLDTQQMGNLDRNTILIMSKSSTDSLLHILKNLFAKSLLNFVINSFADSRLHLLTHPLTHFFTC